MQNPFTLALDFFAGHVISTHNPVSVANMWLARGKAAVRRLGTLQELSTAVVELAPVAGKKDPLIPELLREISARQIALDGTIGDPNDVGVSSRVPFCRVGYAVELTPRGYTLETVELVDRCYRLLRKNGRTLGISCVTLERGNDRRVELYY